MRIDRDPTADEGSRQPGEQDQRDDLFLLVVGDEARGEEFVELAAADEDADQGIAGDDHREIGARIAVGTQQGTGNAEQGAGREE